jgi:hypothetical protein
MLYPVFVNAALAVLGVDPQTIRPELRQSSQFFGKQQGYSPQETALLIAAQLPPAWKAQLDAGVARKWIRVRKVNPLDFNVSGALTELGWAELRPTSMSVEATPADADPADRLAPLSPQQDFLNVLRSTAAGLERIAASWSEPADLHGTLAIQAEFRSLILAIREAGLTYPIEPDGLAMRIAFGDPGSPEWTGAVASLFKNVSNCVSAHKDRAAVVAFSLAPAHVRSCLKSGRSTVALLVEG